MLHAWVPASTAIIVTLKCLYHLLLAQVFINRVAAHPNLKDSNELQVSATRIPLAMAMLRHVDCMNLSACKPMPCHLEWLLVKLGAAFQYGCCCMYKVIAISACSHIRITLAAARCGLHLRPYSHS